MKRTRWSVNSVCGRPPDCSEYRMKTDRRSQWVSDVRLVVTRFEPITNTHFRGKNTAGTRPRALRYNNSASKDPPRYLSQMWINLSTEKKWQLRLLLIIIWGSEIWPFHMDLGQDLVRRPSSFHHDASLQCPDTRLVQSPLHFKRRETTTAYGVLQVGGHVCKNVHQLDNSGVIWGFPKLNNRGVWLKRRKKGDLKNSVWSRTETRLQISTTAK